MSPEKQPEEVQGVPEPEEDAAVAGSEPEADDVTAQADPTDPLAGYRNDDELTPPGTAPPTDGVGSGREEPSEPRRPAGQIPDIRPIQFSQVEGRTSPSDCGSLEMLMDIRLPVSVELGRTQTYVREIMEYGPGSVIELDKLAGDPVDILVNGKLVAQGEVVVIDDHFGVRVTVLLSPRDRVRSLGG